MMKNYKINERERKINHFAIRLMVNKDKFIEAYNSLSKKPKKQKKKVSMDLG